MDKFLASMFVGVWQECTYLLMNSQPGLTAVQYRLGLNNISESFVIVEPLINKSFNLSDM